MLNRRLLVRPDAAANPNRQDYLMRVAAANGLRGIPELCDALGTNYITLASVSATMVNDLLTGVSLTKMGVKGNQPISSGHLKDLGLSARARICPICVGEDRWQDRLFNLALPVPCPHHHVLPVDTCPACGRAFSYLRRDIERCSCGFRLAGCEVRKPPVWMKLFYGLFAPWHLHPTMQDKPYVDIANLDSRCGRLIRVLIADTSTPSNPLLERAWYVSLGHLPALKQLVMLWPLDLKTLLAASEANLGANSRQRLTALFANYPSPLLQQAVQACLPQKRRIRRISKNNLASTETIQSIPVRWLRRFTKLDATAVHELLASDLDRAGWTMKPGGQKLYWPEGVTLQALSAYFMNTIDLDEAAHLLSCTPSYLRHLVKLQCVECEVLSVKPRSPRFKRIALLQWLATLRERAFPLERAKEPLIAINTLRVYSSNQCTLTSWVRLVQAIMDDQVTTYVTVGDFNLSKLFVTQSSLVKYGVRVANQS